MALLSLLALLVAAAPDVYPHNCTYKQGGTGSVTRACADKLADALAAKEFGAKCDGATDDAPALALANTAAVAQGKAIFIGCKLRIASAAGTVAAGLRFEGAGALDLSPVGGSVTLTGPLTAPMGQVFYTGSGTLTFSAKVAQVVPQWWGAVGDGVTDDTTAVAATYAATATSGACIRFPAAKYKFNLTIARNGVCINGDGRTRVASGGTSTIFTPADLTKPIIQIGDGTSLVMYTTIAHFSMLGDGTFTVPGTPTSDGIKILGAYNTTVDDFSIGQMGGKGIWVTSSATRASSYNHFSHGEVISNLYGALVDYGLDFTTATYFTQVNFNPASFVSGDFALRVEGSTVALANCWIQVLDGHGHVYLLKDAGGRAPGLELVNTSIDTGGNSAFTAVDINVGGAHRLINWYITGVSYTIDGKIRWDDATVFSGDLASNVVPPPYRFGVNAKIQQQLYFDIFSGSGGTEFNDAGTPALSFMGQERTTGGAVPILNFAGGHFRVPGVFGQALQLGSASALWKNATTTRLHYRPDFAYPGGDNDGAPFTPLLKTLAYSASMTPVVDQGSRFLIQASNGTAFTVNAPTVNAFTIANLSDYRLTVTISNTGVGALGAATFAAAYHMAAWTQPAPGFQRSITFAFDGVSAWYETSRTPADVPN